MLILKLRYILIESLSTGLEWKITGCYERHFQIIIVKLKIYIIYDKL